LALPARGTWPVRAALLAAPGDTIAVARTTVTFLPHYKVSIAVIAYPNLHNWFICNAVVARVPIASASVPADTLYLLQSAEPISNLPPPVC
jgi:hypothetical protein